MVRSDITLAFNKINAENAISFQSADLLAHSLKFLIHMARCDSEYYHLTTNVKSTLRPIVATCLSVKGSKYLKRQKVVELLFEPWHTRQLLSETKGIYQDREEPFLYKRFQTREQFLQAFSLEPVHEALKLLVDDFYAEVVYSPIELSERYCVNLKRALNCD